MSSLAKKNLPIEFEEYRHKVEAILSEQLEFIRRRLTPQHWSFKIENVGSIDPDALVAELANKLPKQGEQVIYIFRLLNQIHNLDQLQEFIHHHKKIKSEKPEGHARIAGINRSNIPHQEKRLDDVILYVGTSKHFSARIKDHLGYGSLDTACLGLRFWPIFKKQESNCCVDVYSFGSTVQAESIKLMEHVLSNDLKPLIGRNRKA